MTKTAEQKVGSDRSPLLKYGLLASGGFLVDLLLPAVLGMAAWYLLAGGVDLWKLSRVLFVALFFILFLAVSLLSYGLLRTLVNWRKRILPRLRRGWTDNPQKRLVDIALFGLVVPIAFALLANLVPVSSGDPVLAALERRWSAGAEVTAVTSVANASLSASSLETKRRAVEALQAIGSNASLRELFRLLDEDPDALHDRGYYTGMASAFASYGDLARGDLQALLRERAEMPEGDTAGPVPSLYAAHFAVCMETLREEIASYTAQPDTTGALLLALDELQTDLIRGLDRLEEQGGLAGGGDPTLNLVLDSLLELGPGEGDKAVHRLARTMAEDETRANVTRARALLLVAILGSTDDVALFLSILEADDPVLQRSALEAIKIVYGGDGDA